MDTVRFGRALGFGARQAAKTLVAAADAATAAKSSGRSASANTGQVAVVSSRAETSARAAAAVNPSASAARATPDKAVKQAVKTAARTVAQARGMQSGLKLGGRRFGEAVWGPFVRLSGVLWLEVSGVFFGIFALLALGWGWKVRWAWHATAANAADHRRLLGALVMLLLFGYFCVSSFVRARQRERGR